MLNRRKAFTVGIDVCMHPEVRPMSGCVNGPLEMKRDLQSDYFGEPSFNVRLLLGASAADLLTLGTRRSSWIGATVPALRTRLVPTARASPRSVRA